MPKVDTEKLFAIRDEHARLHAEYKALAERAREAQSEADAVRQLHTPGTQAQRAAQYLVLSLPLEELESVSADVIAAANLDPRHVQRVIDTTRRARTLRTQAEALAPALRRHGALLARVNDYASNKEFV